MASVWDDCLDAVVSGIAALDLADIGDRVYKRTVPDVKNVTLPCVVVNLALVSESYLGGTNARDDVGYPVRVDLMARTDVDDARIIAPVLEWRQAVSRAFRFQPLSGVPEVWDCQPEPAPAFDPSLPAYEFVVSSLVLRFVSREVRG